MPPRKYVPVLAILLAGVAVGGGCSLFGPTTEKSQAELILSEAAVCESIGNGLQGLADSGAVAKLDAKGRALLDSARGIARPFCSDPKNPPKDLVSASVKLIQVSGQIAGLAAAVGK